MDWKHEESWFKKEKTFSVEVKRWSRIGYDFNMKPKTINIWNIYVYYFKNDIEFGRITEDCDLGFDFHGGATFFKDDLDVKKIGCDYMHYWDERFEDMTCVEDAYEVFRDADDIFNYLKNRTEGDDKDEV